MARQAPSTSRSGGFTLIEIVVVLTIISILSSIAIVNYRAVQNKAEAARIATQLHYIEDAVIEAILFGATVRDFASINAQNVDQSALGEYLTTANLTDMPPGFSIAMNAEYADSTSNPRHFRVFIIVETTDDDQGEAILRELDAMFPPHTTSLSPGEEWIAIDSRTLALVPDGGV